MVLKLQYVDLADIYQMEFKMELLVVIYFQNILKIIYHLCILKNLSLTGKCL